MPKKIFNIEWPDDYGMGWMNIDNLGSCLTTKQHIGPNIDIVIKDVTEPPPKPKPVQGGHDF